MSVINQSRATPLRNFRRARTLSQAQLATLGELSQQTISKAERGLLQLNPDVQARLAAILGVPRSDLFPEPDQAAAGV